MPIESGDQQGGIVGFSYKKEKLIRSDYTGFEPTVNKNNCVLS
jgi:hypothetical protein